MRIPVIASLFALLVPVVTLAAPPAIKVKDVACVYVSQSVVYAVKEVGRSEGGRLRCQAAVTVSANVELPLALEFQQDGKSVATVTGKAALTAKDKDCKVELETPVPPLLEGCTKFDIVMTVGTTKRTVHVQVTCGN